MNEILRVDVEQTHGEDIHRVILTSCFHLFSQLLEMFPFLQLRFAVDDVPVGYV